MPAALTFKFSKSDIDDLTQDINCAGLVFSHMRVWEVAGQPNSVLDLKNLYAHKVRWVESDLAVTIPSTTADYTTSTSNFVRAAAFSQSMDYITSGRFNSNDFLAPLAPGGVYPTDILGAAFLTKSILRQFLQEIVSGGYLELTLCVVTMTLPPNDDPYTPYWTFKVRPGIPEDGFTPVIEAVKYALAISCPPRWRPEAAEGSNEDDLVARPVEMSIQQDTYNDPNPNNNNSKKLSETFLVELPNGTVGLAKFGNILEQFGTPTNYQQYEWRESKWNRFWALIKYLWRTFLQLVGLKKG